MVASTNRGGGGDGAMQGKTECRQAFFYVGMKTQVCARVCCTTRSSSHRPPACVLPALSQPTKPASQQQELLLGTTSSSRAAAAAVAAPLRFLGSAPLAGAQIPIAPGLGSCGSKPRGLEFGFSILDWPAWPASRPLSGPAWGGGRSCKRPRRPGAESLARPRRPTCLWGPFVEAARGDSSSCRATALHVACRPGAPGHGRANLADLTGPARREGIWVIVTGGGGDRERCGWRGWSRRHRNHKRFYLPITNGAAQIAQADCPNQGENILKRHCCILVVVCRPR